MRLSKSLAFGCFTFLLLTSSAEGVPSPDAQSLVDEDAVILVNPFVQNQEIRAPRQYEVPQAAGQRVGGQSPKDLVSDIHCLKTATVETLTAFLHMPEGFSSGPVLESIPVADNSKCLITRTNADSIFALDLSRMESCGVRECQEQGEIWMCVTIRFPMLTGLKMPEDEVIDIKCKPQDPAIAGNNIINFQENLVEQRSPAIYIGGGQEFLSEIGLFRKLPGTDLFASRVKSGSTIELGENVQLRSIVRSGDGWNYAKITDVVVHRVHEGKALTSPKDTAQLVFSDGCRNPSYRALAVANPWRDVTNGLINNFDFRVFMFQDMDSGDSIMISAKVIACVEEIDCAPIRCGQDPDNGYGKRKKRSVNNTMSGEQSLSKTKGWEENLELKIRMPQDLMYDREGNVDSLRYAGPLGLGRPIDESECKMYLIITLSVALTFCVLSASVVLIACIRRYQENRVSKRLKELEKNQEKFQNNGDILHQISNPDDDGGFVKNPNQTIPEFYLRKPSDCQSNPSRPVTVRSVKRRDKAKVEEKNNRMILGSWPSKQHQPFVQGPSGSGPEERAIMV